MTLSPVNVCNLALDELPSGAIVSLDENTLNAEVCRRHYPQVLGELLDLEWSFAVRRAPLVAVANTREPFWRYAYVAPADMASPLRLTRTPGTSGNVTLLAGQTLAPGVFTDDPGLPFDIEGRAIWSAYDGVTLEYVTNDPAFPDFTRTFERALVLALAARICMPITKDRQRKMDLMSEAEVARERAYAADLNRNASENQYGQNFIPDVMRLHIEGEI